MKVRKKVLKLLDTEAQTLKAEMSEKEIQTEAREESHSPKMERKTTFQTAAQKAYSNQEKKLKGASRDSFGPTGQDQSQ